MPRASCHELRCRALRCGDPAPPRALCRSVRTSLTEMCSGVQSQQARYWKWTEERVNYPPPLVDKRLPQRGASARSFVVHCAQCPCHFCKGRMHGAPDSGRRCGRVEAQSVPESAARTATSVDTLRANTERDALSSGDGGGGPRVPHAQLTVQDRQGRTPCDGKSAAPDAGAHRSGGTALRWRPASAGAAPRAPAPRAPASRMAEASGAASRRLEPSLADGRRPASARPRHDSFSSASAGSVSLLLRTRSTPPTAPPANLVHASAAAEGDARGSHVQAARISKAGGAEMNAGADRTKGSVMNRLVGQQRPRLDPSQRLDPPLLRRGEKSFQTVSVPRTAVTVVFEGCG